MRRKKAAHEKIHALDARHAFPSPIVTDVVEAGPFYEAEDYHQKYLMKRGLGSCHV
jgi:peptide-methionine (S)-S-oxide reductase